jgi:hypothetical protein
LREYAFDVKLFAVVRISARTRKQAEAILNQALDCADLDVNAMSRHGTARVTQASLSVDDEGYPYLCEVDGIDVDNDESEANVDDSDLEDFDQSG